MTPHTISERRRRAAWGLTMAGLVFYNWWLAVLLRPSLLKSPNELFSNLEVSGQPFANWMQHADLVAGMLLCVAFVVVGVQSLQRGVGEWLLLVAFAVSGAAGGYFPEQCLDTINRSCHLDELELQLGGAQYLHIVAGILEFAAITGVLILSYRRTRGERSPEARIYRSLYLGAWVLFPLLAIAYLFVLGGSFVEGAFFTGFTLIVVTQIFERTSRANTSVTAHDVPLMLRGQPCRVDRQA